LKDDNSSSQKGTVHFYAFPRARASKGLTESTGSEANTTHRLLEVQRGSGRVLPGMK
jgi:hypothetical protein